MTTNQLPIPLARAAMRVLPAPLLQRSVDLLMRRLRQRHAALFDNLTRLDLATIVIAPSDLPHRFALRFGPSGVSLRVINGRDLAHQACVTGRLSALIDLLEGRIDSDMLFFARHIEISGDTSVVVGLRNTIDREEINLFDEIMAIGGHLARPLRRVLLACNGAAQRIRERLQGPTMAEHRRSLEERDRLLNELRDLKKRLAKFEVRQKRQEMVAG